MKTNYYGIVGEDVSELEQENRSLARKAAAESFVLLKNEGALPLTNHNIALYGMGARKTVKGGLGSGSVEERYSVNIETGLKNAGFKITSENWLNDYDKEYDETYQKWHDMVESKVDGLTDPMEIIPLAHSFVYRYPSGRLITEEDVKMSNTDTAIYVIMRQAGECRDRRLEKGDYLLTDLECNNLKMTAESYKHTILVINIGGTIDLSFVDQIKGIDAIISFVQGGEEGGNALADVLSGKINFSGKLADTWLMNYKDAPFGQNYSYLNDNLDDEDYSEGIYVGYRYYDTFNKTVMYPFGYGLSYTDFEIDITSVLAEGNNIQMKVWVKNTGSLYSGKEVVQVYLSAPDGKLKKEFQSLVAFTKTKELRPGEEESLELSFKMETAASYAEESSQWILEAGEYALRVGNHSRNTIVAAILTLDRTIVTRQCRQCCAPELNIEEIEVPDRNPVEVSTDLDRIKIDTDVFTTEIIDYTDPDIVETEKEKTILDSLTIKEMAELLRGGALRNPPKGCFEILGAGGKTTTSLLHKGIRNITLSDGPAGINITKQVCFCEDGSVKPAIIPERYNWGTLAKTAAQNLMSTEGIIVSRFATAWPVQMLLAQSWDVELLKEIGKAMGNEMELFGITILLAPGMNIHRNPLCGRNFEYYSEDPLVSGKLAAAFTLGIQSRSGSGTTIKHFCCNNSEDNRTQSSSNVNERALREIYLKGFEIAVKESQPLAVMTSYNMLNHIYTANQPELVTDILRCEWGFEGVVMTDWNSCGNNNGLSAKCAPAGNDLIMPGSNDDIEKILEAIGTGEIEEKDMRCCACRVLRMMLQANTPILE